MKNLIKFLTVVGCVCMTVVSCNDMNNIHQKYIDAGERVYLGMTDSLMAFDGYKRVKLLWYINANPHVETTVIYWNNRRDSLEKSFIRTQDGVQKDSVFIPLPEGSYNFELVNKNQHGDRSLTVTIQGTSYGDEYTGDLKARPVNNISTVGFDPVTQSSTLKITWGEAPSGSVSSKVTYKKRTTGEEVVVNAVSAETILTDVGNRLGHSDDMLYISSVYSPAGCMDFMESAKQKYQVVIYMATGTRIENTLYDGVNTTFTYQYANQDKTFLLQSEKNGVRVYGCNRVAELSPLTPTTQFSVAFSGTTVNVSGYYASGLNLISDATTASTFDEATGSLTLRYSVKTAGGSYSIVETLVPKTTPVEKEASKPFGDVRASVPYDNNTQNSAFYAFSKIYDGINSFEVSENGWIGANAATSPSFTLDLKEKLTLTRMILCPMVPLGYPAYPEHLQVYGYYNCMEFEIWGTPELPVDKPDAYWADKADPTGTFKADWVYLGYHKIERLDKKGASVDEILGRGRYGNHFILDSAAPVRYIRFFNRAPGSVYGTINLYAIAELSFYGYGQ